MNDVDNTKQKISTSAASSKSKRLFPFSPLFLSFLTHTMQSRSFTLHLSLHLRTRTDAPTECWLSLAASGRMFGATSLEEHTPSAQARHAASTRCLLEACMLTQVMNDAQRGKSERPWSYKQWSHSVVFKSRERSACKIYMCTLSGFGLNYRNLKETVLNIDSIFHFHFSPGTREKSLGWLQWIQWKQDKNGNLTTSKNAVNSNRWRRSLWMILYALCCQRKLRSL